MIILTINNWRKSAKEKVARDWDFQIRNFGMAYFTGKRKFGGKLRWELRTFLWTLPFKATFKKAYHMHPSVFPWSGVRRIKLWQRLKLTLIFRSLFLCNQAIRRSLVLRSSLKRRGASVVRKKAAFSGKKTSEQHDVLKDVSLLFVSPGVIISVAESRLINVP